MNTLPTRFISLVGRMFVNGPGTLGPIPGCVMPKNLKTVLDISLLNTQQYKVRIEGKDFHSNISNFKILNLMIRFLKMNTI